MDWMAESGRDFYVRSVKLGTLYSIDKLCTARFSKFCEVSRVKYCVYAYPSGYPTVQTHGGIERAMSYPRPDEERGGDLYS